MADTRHTIETAGYPTSFMLAGPSRGTEVGGDWQHAGAMPFMSPLTSDHRRTDRRVRRADDGDFDLVADPVADSYGIAREAADVAPAIPRLEQDAMKIWLLGDDGQAVSTVLTANLDDAVCAWCMGTPAPFRRRGYGRALLADVLLRAKREEAGIGLLGATRAGKPLSDATGWHTPRNGSCSSMPSRRSSAIERLPAGPPHPRHRNFSPRP